MRYLLLVSVFVFFNYFSFEQKTVDLKIVVSNIKEKKGSLEIGIYNTPSSFPKKNKEYRAYSLAVTHDTMLIDIKGLVKGDYAIGIYHDQNSDNKCNKNILGLPTEPYGFSNNYKPRITKPSFKKCKIQLNKNKTINIKLID